MLRQRLTYANVMATLGVFIALGGTSYAALNLPANSVGTAQLRKNAVTGAKVKNGSLTLADLSHSGILRGPVGPLGATGAAGAAGQQGVPGPTGPSDAYRAQGGSDVPMSTQPNVATTMVQLTSLPPGQYVFWGQGDVANRNSGSEVACFIIAQGDELGAANGSVGENTANSFIVPYAVTGAATEQTTFNVQYECQSNVGFSDPPFTEGPSLVAIRVGTLHTQ